MIYNIDKGLSDLGCRSIVACSADSRVAGEQYSTVRHSLGDYVRESRPEQTGLIKRHLAMALKRAEQGDIDVIHIHGWLDYIYAGLFNPRLPIIMTLHVPAGDSWIEKNHYHRLNTMENPSMHFVAISEYQKRQYEGLTDINTVYHGIDLEDWPFKERPERDSYLFSIGRVTSVKGQDKAIEVAKRAGARLVIAGCVQDKPADRKFFAGLRDSIGLFADISRKPAGKDYYENTIRPILDSDRQIIYIGELDSEQKKQWYRHAGATLFPIQWGEPFGLVLIESMACGTPVLAFREGSVPEIVEDGKTGFVVDSLSEMIDAVGRIDSIDPRRCRKHVQKRFSVPSMAGRYSELYQQILADNRITASHEKMPVGDLLKLIPHGQMAS